MKSSFTTTDIVKRLGISFGRIREWIVGGYVKPSVPSPGQGKPAEFSLWDLYMIELFRHLVDMGLSRELASQFIKFLGKLGMKGKPVPVLEQYLVFTKKGEEIKSYLIGTSVNLFLKLQVDQPLPLDDRKDPQNLLRVGDWETIIIVDFKKIRERVDSAIK